VRSWFVRLTTTCACTGVIIVSQLTVATGRSWTEEKCVRYANDWRALLQRGGETGLSKEFLGDHKAFIASGCSGPRMVCPRSAREIEIANVMTIRAMNAGMASTFPPFACKAGS
jgi:hypothetical protein